MKKTEGMQRNMIYSKEKEKRRALVLCVKAMVRTLKGKRVKNKLIERRKEISNIAKDVTTTEKVIAKLDNE